MENMDVATEHTVGNRERNAAGTITTTINLQTGRIETKQLFSKPLILMPNQGACYEVLLECCGRAVTLARKGLREES